MLNADIKPVQTHGRGKGSIKGVRAIGIVCCWCCDCHTNPFGVELSPSPRFSPNVIPCYHRYIAVAARSSTPDVQQTPEKESESDNAPSPLHHTLNCTINTLLLHCYRAALTIVLRLYYQYYRIISVILLHYTYYDPIIILYYYYTMLHLLVLYCCSTTASTNAAGILVQDLEQVRVALAGKIRGKILGSVKIDCCHMA